MALRRNLPSDSFEDNVIHTYKHFLQNSKDYFIGHLADEIQAEIKLLNLYDDNAIARAYNYYDSKLLHKIEIFGRVGAKNLIDAFQKEYSTLGDKAKVVIKRAEVKAAEKAEVRADVIKRPDKLYEITLMDGRKMVWTLELLEQYLKGAFVIPEVEMKERYVKERRGQETFEDFTRKHREYAVVLGNFFNEAKKSVGRKEVELPQIVVAALFKSIKAITFSPDIKYQDTIGGALKDFNERYEELKQRHPEVYKREEPRREEPRMEAPRREEPRVVEAPKQYPKEFTYVVKDRKGRYAGSQIINDLPFFEIYTNKEGENAKYISKFKTRDEAEEASIILNTQFPKDGWVVEHEEISLRSARPKQVEKVVNAYYIIKNNANGKYAGKDMENNLPFFRWRTSPNADKFKTLGEADELLKVLQVQFPGIDINIEQKETGMAHGGSMANGGEVKVVTDTDGTWYLKKIDSTHFYLSNRPDNTPDNFLSAYHIGEFRNRPFYEEVRSWLKSSGGSLATGGEATLEASPSIFDDESVVLPVLKKALFEEHWGTFVMNNETWNGGAGSYAKKIKPFSDNVDDNFKDKLLSLIIKHFSITGMTYQSLLHSKNYNLIKKYFQYFKPFVLESLDSYQVWETTAMEELFNYLGLDYKTTYTHGYYGIHHGAGYTKDDDANMYNKQQIENLSLVGSMATGGELPEKGTPEWHQLQIAKKTINMNPAMVGVMGGQTIEEAKKILDKYGIKYSSGGSMATGGGAGKDKQRFFQLAEKLGLVKNGKYIAGIPSGDKKDVNEFYSLEDKLGYPKEQKVSGSMATGGVAEDFWKFYGGTEIRSLEFEGVVYVDGKNKVLVMDGEKINPTIQQIKTLKQEAFEGEGGVEGLMAGGGRIIPKFKVGDKVMVDDSGYAKYFVGFDTTKPATIRAVEKLKIYGKIKYGYALTMADGKMPFNRAAEHQLTLVEEQLAKGGKIPVILEIKTDYTGIPERGGYLTVEGYPRMYVWDYQLSAVKADYSKAPYKLTIKKIKE